MSIDKTGFVRWVTGGIVLLTLGGFFVRNFLTWNATQSGESPQTAFLNSEQRVTHALLNPWVAVALLFALLLLLGLVVWEGKKKGWKTTNWLFFGTIVVSLVALISRLVHSH